MDKQVCLNDTTTFAVLAAIMETLHKLNPACRDTLGAKLRQIADEAASTGWKNEGDTVRKLIARLE